MILLPHGCSCSQPAVTPKNWRTTKKITSNWRIHYYFRDPKHREKHPYGKLITVKGMNTLKTLEERREATQLLLDEEMYMLKVEGYNPIDKKLYGPDLTTVGDIDCETLLTKAVDMAFERLEVTDNTRKDILIIKRKFNRAAILLRFDTLRIKDVRRKHVRLILEKQAQQNGYSNNRFNKARAYMQMIFKELLISEAIDYNPVDNIPKKKHTMKLRETLTDIEVDRIRKHLKENYYTFYRYMEIFFHSGGRSTELMKVRKEDVNIKQQIFKVTVKKGRNYTQEYRAINNNVLHLWNELLSDAKKGDYLFSKGLVPGDVSIDAWQISTRWRKHVKDKLGVDKDFYALKHLHTVKVIDLYGRNLAAGINGHKSTKMNDRHYDTMHQQRLLEEAKKIDVSL